MGGGSVGAVGHPHILDESDMNGAWEIGVSDRESVMERMDRGRLKLT